MNGMVIVSGKAEEILFHLVAQPRPADSAKAEAANGGRKKLLSTQNTNQCQT